MIQLLIVDPVRLTCNVMAAALGHEPDFCIVGYATTAPEALAQVRHSNVVLLSAALADLAPLDLARAILTANPATKVVLIGLPDSEELIIQSIEAGVAGYVLRKDSLAGLLATIRAVYHNEARVSPEIAAVMMMHFARLAAVRSAQKLLQRES